MMRTVARVGLVAIALVGASGIARADIVASLVFTTPTAAPIQPTDSIPVWLTLTLDSSSDAIQTDASGQVTTYTLSQVAANLFGGLPIGVDINNDSLSANVNLAFGCSGTFTTI